MTTWGFKQKLALLSFNLGFPTHKLTVSDYLFIPTNSGLSKGLIFFTLNILLVRKLFGLFCRIWFLLCCFWTNCYVRQDRSEAKQSKAESDDPSPVHRAGGLAHSTCTAQHSLPSPGGGAGFLAVSRLPLFTARFPRNANQFLRRSKTAPPKEKSFPRAAEEFAD